MQYILLQKGNEKKFEITINFIIYRIIKIYI